MNLASNNVESVAGGILIRGAAAHDMAAVRHTVLSQLDAVELDRHVLLSEGTDAAGRFVRFKLRQEQIDAWAPGLDTLALCQTLKLDTRNKPGDLTREIVVAMLMGPTAFEFPSVAELVSAVRIRHNTVQAARKTTLDFRTSEAERPQDCWIYVEGRGFTLRPGVSLITALAKATQPDLSGMLYSFSCYRASEYVILLGIAQELAQCNPPLYQQLETLWTSRAIMSGEFHEVFLREQGSMREPMPPRYFVPGDRTWFRNPDSASSDASGFEGSWVMYMGEGLFSNFWKRDKPFTLATKCLEIYHWRHAVYLDAQGNARIDEAKVEALVQATLREPAEISKIQELMQRYREPGGVYVAGGCIDTTREFARWVHPGTTDLVLPQH